MRQKKKRWLDSIFVICFLGLLLLPLLFLDTTETINSDLENRTLTSWPGIHFSKLYNEWYGHYVEDRAGFREEAIKAQVALNYYIFGEFSEDLHMYGKDHYIFSADGGYVENYQHLNTQQDMVLDLCTYLERTSEYADEKGADFIFMICPNKSSVYSSEMPDSIHVAEDKISNLELCKEELSKRGVSYVIPDEEFKARKNTEQIYNVSFDCAHWNDLGALYGLSLVDEKIAEEHGEIPRLFMADFDLTYEKKQVDFLTVPLLDTVPVLTLKRDGSRQTDSELLPTLPVEPGNNMAYFYNQAIENDTCILILHDSFLDDRAEWFAYRYKEVYFTSRTNYSHMKEYIDQIHPDVILYENAERSFADDLSAYTLLGTLEYE